MPDEDPKEVVRRDQVIAWWASARAAGARALITEVTAGAGTLLVRLEATGTPPACDAGPDWLLAV